MLVGLALTLLAAGAAVAAKNSRDRIDAVLNEAGPLRADAEALLTALVDQETGVRGYVLSGRPADLRRYEDGVAQQARVVQDMTGLVADRSEIRRELVAVEGEVARWRSAVAVPAVEAVRRGGPTAGQAVLTDAARQQFDAVRRSVERLQESVLRLRDEFAVQARSSSSTLVLFLVLAAVIVLVAGAMLLLLLDRMVIRPVTGLATQVREIAGGDYDRVISSDGPPELARLARDVDGMRRQIAADLTAVRTAQAKIEDAHRRLEEQAEELTRSNRDLEQFAYVASHDLQEPLRKVASFCQLLQRRYSGQLDERADQYIAFAVDGAQRMQRLINDLLAFSRIGRLTAGFVEVDLDAVMREVAGQLDPAREAVHGEIIWSDLPVVQGEEPLLTTLLMNLVNNSLKFRRPEVAPRVEISGRRIGDEWQITCRDNGIGIEQEFADKVFVIFQRLHAKDAYPGTGIGLAIAKKIVEYHGGRIWLESGHTDGTDIRFALPATVPRAEPADPPPPGETAGAAADSTAPGDSAPGDIDPAKETVA